LKRDGKNRKRRGSLPNLLEEKKVTPVFALVRIRTGQGQVYKVPCIGANSETMSRRTTLKYGSGTELLSTEVVEEDEFRLRCGGQPRLVDHYIRFVEGNHGDQVFAAISQDESD